MIERSSWILLSSIWNSKGYQQTRGHNFVFAACIVTWDLVRSEIRLEEGFINNSSCLRFGPPCISPSPSIPSWLPTSFHIARVSSSLCGPSYRKTFRHAWVIYVVIRKLGERQKVEGSWRWTRLLTKIYKTYRWCRASCGNDEKYASITNMRARQDRHERFSIRVPEHLRK